jgi:pimeloyl-ACP methyl ester carboxylesterase
MKQLRQRQVARAHLAADALIGPGFGRPVSVEVAGTDENRVAREALGQFQADLCELHRETRCHTDPRCPSYAALVGISPPSIRISCIQRVYVASMKVIANGLEIAYERAGEGPLVVFVHGAAEDGRIWQPQLSALADQFTVVAWDEPGAGRSAEVPADFGLTDYANCLATLIESLGLGPAHVAGLSWGGTVALELYRHHPGLLATLVLIDAYAGWKGSLSEDEVRARVAGARLMLAAPAREFDPTLPGLFAAAPPTEFIPLLDDIAADVRPESLRTQLFVMAEADQRDLLPHIDVPTLLVWGELDARSPLNVARQFEEAIPDTQLVVIPGAGHVSNLEEPEKVTDAIREFCRAHPPRTS